MKYALLIYDKPETFSGMSEAELGAAMSEYRALTERPDYLAGEQLQPTQTATTVRVHDGETLLSDGPFAETKEVFGGFYLVQADDLDGALEFASRIPSARLGGCVEVRPVVER